jgi:hypothetical protein
MGTPLYRNVYDVINERRGNQENPSPDWTPLGVPEPTRLLPGSPAKIALLRSRLEAGLEMWNEDKDVNLHADRRERT